MEVSNVGNQELRLKEKVKIFFLKSLPSLKEGLCPTKDLMAATLDKWSLFILYNLGYHKTLRFNELKKNIRGISARMLSVSLKKLEKHRLLKRKVFAEVPPRVEYELTEFGKDLTERMVDFNDWFMDAAKFPYEDN